MGHGAWGMEHGAESEGRRAILNIKHESEILIVT